MSVLGLSRTAHDGVLPDSCRILRHHRGRHAHLPLLLFRIFQHLGCRPTPDFSFLVPFILHIFSSFMSYLQYLRLSQAQGAPSVISYNVVSLPLPSVLSAVPFPT
jgi:hypothetical protein